MILNTPVKINTNPTGESVVDLIIKVKFNFDNLTIDGVVPCELTFQQVEESDRVYPIVEGGKVTNCYINCDLDDTIKSSGVSKLYHTVAYVYAKVKLRLEETYGWTITI